MGIRGVRLKADDRRMIGDEPRAGIRVHHARLHRRFAHVGAAAQLAAGPAQGFRRDASDRLRRAPMTRQLARRPARRKARDQRARRDDARAESFDQLDDAVRHAIEIGHGIGRRDFHRDGLAGDERAQLVVELAPRRVRAHLARESVERGELDAVRQRDRLALARQQHEKAARPHAVDAKHARRGGIDAVKVVQQPTVGPHVAEQLAQRGEIELVEEAHWCRGSGPAARHSHPAPPRARQSTCTIAPS